MTEPQAIARDLLAWFRQAKRDLPWRRERDAYRVLVSEVMLQQTQVATVIPYFERFMALYPTPAALAAAPTEQVLKAWEGLGYYSRGRNLQAAARVVTERHGGRMPDTFEGLRALPGVGDYTAGAVASIAFGRAVPAVDGNVLRVVARLALVQEDVARPATKKRIAAIAQALLPAEAPGDFNEALMELGATVCAPRRPACDRCPVARHCRGLAAGRAEALPVKAKKKPPQPVTLAAVVVERDDALLLVKRPDTGIWGGLWGLPAVEVPAGTTAEAAMAEHLEERGLQTQRLTRVTTLAHTLTHRQLTLPILRAEGVAGAWRGEAAWVSRAELPAYALPVPFQKALAALAPGPLFDSVV